jgi:hypothetical protein
VEVMSIRKSRSAVFIGKFWKTAKNAPRPASARKRAELAGHLSRWVKTLGKNVALLAELDTELARALVGYRRERDETRRAEMEARVVKKHSLIRSIETTNNTLREKIRSVGRGEFGSIEAMSQSAFADFKRLEPLVTGRKPTPALVKLTGASLAKPMHDSTRPIQRSEESLVQQGRGGATHGDPGISDFGKKLREAMKNSKRGRRPKR